jgi:hypothetical protein
MFAEAQETVRKSFQAQDWFTRNAWSYVIWSQTSVLLWYQIGVPFFVLFTGSSFPKTGDLLLQWAYALVGGALFGLGMKGMGSLKDLLRR